MRSLDSETQDETTRLRRSIRWSGCVTSSKPWRSRVMKEMEGRDGTSKIRRAKLVSYPDSSPATRAAQAAQVDRLVATERAISSKTRPRKIVPVSAAAMALNPAETRQTVATLAAICVTEATAILGPAEAREAVPPAITHLAGPPA